MFKFIKRSIKVFFICQYMQGCNKIYDVITAMKDDKLFDVKVLAVPDDINDFPKNSNYAFWKSKFGNVTINSIKDNKWVNLRKFKPDYVFIQRPYDNYLPYEYQIDTIKKYTKVCYIPYGFELINLRNITLPVFFIKNISLLFCSQREEYEYCKKVIIESNDNIKTKCFNLGYPSLSNIVSNINNHNSAFRCIPKKCNFNVIWTPRWTIDDDLCKTSFFDYKDLMVRYMKERKNINFVFRPHPLSFKNYVEKKIMTKNDVNFYLKNFKNNNLYYDSSSDYYDTFFESDVLITDFSSIIVEYFLFNKPIIYCSGKTRATSFMKKMLKCFYCVSNWNELIQALENIMNGNDYLKPKREKLLKDFLKNYKEDISLKILSELKNDFYK